MDIFILCGLIDEHTLGQNFFESNSAEEYMTQFHVCLQLLPLHTYQKANFVVMRRGKFCNCYFFIEKKQGVSKSYVEGYGYWGCILPN